MTARTAYALYSLLLAAGCNGALRFEQPSDSQGDGPDAALAASCKDDQDCALTALHCDRVSGQCVECSRDQDCADPSEPRCDTALHRCVGCGGDIDCQSGETCLPSSRICVTRCAEGPQENLCPESTPTCDEVARICVQCSSDADCRAISDDGDYCEQDSGRCVHCTDDRQCPATQPRCDPLQHRCGQCSSSADCPDGRVCDPARLRCI